MNLLNIIKYEYGLTTQEAKTYLKNVDEKTKTALIEGYNKQAKKCFYND